MTEDTQFVCGACGIDYQGDTRNVMTQCRACQRRHCNGCGDYHYRRFIRTCRQGESI